MRRGETLFSPCCKKALHSPQSCYNSVMENIFELLVLCMTIAASAGGVSWRLGGMEARLNARIDRLEIRIDGLEARLSKVETEVHSINEHLRRSPV